MVFSITSNLSFSTDTYKAISSILLRLFHLAFSSATRTLDKTLSNKCILHFDAINQDQGIAISIQGALWMAQSAGLISPSLPVCERSINDLLFDEREEVLWGLPLFQTLFMLDGTIFFRLWPLS
jgi:hypothetical protein